jgi:hypothetical protein
VPDRCDRVGGHRIAGIESWAATFRQARWSSFADATGGYGSRTQSQEVAMSSMSHDPSRSSRAGMPIEGGATRAEQADGPSSRREGVKQEAADLGGEAAGATRDVVDTAKEQGREVAGDVRQQARRLTDQTRDSMSSQVQSQRDRAIGRLRTMSDELRTMSESSQDSGVGARVTRQAGVYAGQLADFLQDREPGELLDQARSFARQRPGVFLLGAAVAGVVAGRLSRGLVDVHRDGRSDADRDDRPPADVGDASLSAPMTGLAGEQDAFGTSGPAQGVPGTPPSSVVAGTPDTPVSHPAGGAR